MTEPSKVGWQVRAAIDDKSSPRFEDARGQKKTIGLAADGSEYCVFYS